MELCIDFWETTLKVASYYGWEPLGTRKQAWKDPVTGEIYTSLPSEDTLRKRVQRVEDDTWNGSYTGDDVTILKEDGQALAKALRKAEADIPMDLATYRRFAGQRDLVFCPRGDRSQDPELDHFLDLVTLVMPAFCSDLAHVIRLLQGEPCTIFYWR